MYRQVFMRTGLIDPICFTLKRWDTNRGRHVVEHAHGFGLRTLESLLRIVQEQEDSCGALRKLDRRWREASGLSVSTLQQHILWISDIPSVLFRNVGNLWSVVGNLTRLRAEGSRVRNSAAGRIFPLLQTFQTGSGVHPTSYSKRSEALSRR